MKKLIYLLLFFPPLFCAAQNYIPLPMENAYWRFSFGCIDGMGGINAQYQVSTAGDTLVQSIHYQKLKLSGGANVSYGFCSASPAYDIYMGCMRQDSLNRIVYIIKALDSTEKILYDFAQNAGDTLHSVLIPEWNPSSPISIQSVDSLLIGTTYHRRMNLSCSCQPNFQNDAAIIEGVGSNSGLLQNFLGFERANTLDCVRHNNQTIYPAPGSACNLVYTNSVEIEPVRYSLGPNPFEDSFVIAFSKVIDKGIFEMWDVFSRRVCSFQFEGVNQLSIPRLTMNPGICFFRINCMHNGSFSGKVIAK